MSGTLHFLTRRRLTSTFPHSTESWAQTSPSCLKPPHPLESSWKTWASKTSFGSNWAVSKAFQVTCLIWTSLRCDTSWGGRIILGMKDLTQLEISVLPGTPLQSTLKNYTWQQHCHLLFLHWEITAAYCSHLLQYISFYKHQSLVLGITVP